MEESGHFQTDDLDAVLNEVDLLIDADPIKILREVVPKLIAEIRTLRTQNENLRERWWRHTNDCSMLCTDACNEAHTYVHGCACQ